VGAKDVIRQAIISELDFAIDTRMEWFEHHCESPIEAIFGVFLTMSLDMSYPSLLEWCEAGREVENTFDKCSFLLIPQYRWQNYRIDWALRIKGAKRPWIFIECDGHDFHERTKEQAERDRSKDREIQAADITIFRFTGRELWRDPVTCAEQVINLMVTRFKENGA